MPEYKGLNDTIVAERIYCVFERTKGKPHKISTRGRHNAQSLTVEGNPATAVITKTLRYIKD